MKRLFTARRDKLDERDLVYRPEILTVPREIGFSELVKRKALILDQGSEGACTGFGLAACLHELQRRHFGEVTPVSPWMLYASAKEADEFPGEDYEGSTCRGALKGWARKGVLPLTAWGEGRTKALTRLEQNAAAQIPCGHYARVSTRNLRDLHVAIALHGAVFCSAETHPGWDKVDRGTGKIPFQARKPSGGHAFAIVGYDSSGFWIQNSWGKDWGRRGYALWSYDDFTSNIADAWVLSLGVPVNVMS